MTLCIDGWNAHWLQQFTNAWNSSDADLEYDTPVTQMLRTIVMLRQSKRNIALEQRRLKLQMK
jgi:hypothetical protein